MTLPNENCPTFFSCQTDLKCSGECTKRINMETKNAALELAQELEEAARSYRAGEGGPHINVLISSVTILRSQAAEIELLTEWQRGAKDVAITSDWHRDKREEAEQERDQLKAKNEKLVDALEELMGWQVKSVKLWSKTAYDYASKALKENT